VVFFAPLRRKLRATLKPPVSPALVKKVHSKFRSMENSVPNKIKPASDDMVTIACVGTLRFLVRIVPNQVSHDLLGVLQKHNMIDHWNTDIVLEEIAAQLIFQETGQCVRMKKRDASGVPIE
jgi:hypothetical protein